MVNARADGHWNLEGSAEERVLAVAHRVKATGPREFTLTEVREAGWATAPATITLPRRPLGDQAAPLTFSTVR